MGEDVVKRLIFRLHETTCPLEDTDLHQESVTEIDRLRSELATARCDSWLECREEAAHAAETCMISYAAIGNSADEAVQIGKCRLGIAGAIRAIPTPTSKEQGHEG